MGLAGFYDRAAAWLNNHPAKRAGEVWASLCVGAAALTYGTYRIVVYRSILLPTRSGGVLVQGGAAWIVYAGMACGAFAFFGYALGLRAKKDDRQGYWKFSRWAKRAGLVLFFAGLLLNVVVWLMTPG